MNKKGFTLIELLAVIVILAIIALIAVPSVLNIIEESKESAVKESARNISRAAETYYMQGVMKGGTPDSIDLTTDTLKYNGEKPEKGLLTYDETGRAHVKMYMNGYCVNVDFDNTVNAEKKDKSECKINAVILSLNPMGGNLSEQSKEYDKGDSIGTLPTLEKEGYIFNGWVLSDGTKVTESTKITETMTINASWEAKTYTITLNDGNDEVIDETKVVTFDSAYGELPIPTKEGYNFIGWKLDNGENVNSETIVKIADNHYLYAQWEKITYTKYKDGTPLLYDPVNNIKCSANEVETNYNVYGSNHEYEKWDSELKDYVIIPSISGLNYGCMKFYAFLDSEESETVNLILDHNTTGYSLHNEDAMEYLNSEVANWNEEVRATARLISPEEITKIAPYSDNINLDEVWYTQAYYFHTGNETPYGEWDNPVEAGTNKYAWLFDNTNECTKFGCYRSDPDTWNFGYWTSDFGRQGWLVYSDGSFYKRPGLGNEDLGHGIRPVITVSKEVFK